MHVLVSISKINKKDNWRQICGFNLYCAGVSLSYTRVVRFVSNFNSDSWLHK